MLAMNANYPVKKFKKNKTKENGIVFEISGIELSIFATNCILAIFCYNSI